MATVPHDSDKDYPVFVGGTGRSGTTICARLLGHHSRYHLIPIEVQFHVRPRGFSDLLQDPQQLPRFLHAMRAIWFFVERQGKARGLHRILDSDALESCLAEFEKDFPQDPEVACRLLMQSLLSPLAKSAGKATWVEMSPPNVRQAGTLTKLFPEARFIHMTRDGRDVACSLERLAWAPASLIERLEWWANELEESNVGAANVPPNRILTLRLEDLVRDRREESYTELLDFLSLDDEPDMRTFFETKMVPERANLGRWREDSGAEARALASRHLELVTAMGTLTPVLEGNDSTSPA